MKKFLAFACLAMILLPTLVRADVAVTLSSTVVAPGQTTGSFDVLLTGASGQQLSGWDVYFRIVPAPGAVPDIVIPEDFASSAFWTGSLTSVIDTNLPETHYWATANQAVPVTLSSNSVTLFTVFFNVPPGTSGTFNIVPESATYQVENGTQTSVNFNDAISYPAQYNSGVITIGVPTPSAGLAGLSLLATLGIKRRRRA